MNKRHFKLEKIKIIDKTSSATFFQYGVIINVKNINYIITTYISDITNIQIFLNNEEIHYDKIIKQYMFNITIFKLINVLIPNKTNFINKLHKIKQITVESDEIELTLNTNSIKYELVDAKHPILPKLLMITTTFKSTEDILSRLYEGNIVYSGNMFIGIIGHLEVNKIYIIPSYVIISQLNKQSNNIYNIWNDIDKFGYVYNDIFNNFVNGDKIIKYNNSNIEDGYIFIKEINFNIPLQTYIYYTFNKYNKKKFTVIRSENEAIINCLIMNIDDVLCVPFHNVSDCSNLSFEKIDNYLNNSIEIDENIIEHVFEYPFKK